VAVNLHMMLKVPRFTRAIMQSGQAHLIGPKTIEFHEKMYSMVLQHLKLDKTAKSARLEELKTMPLEKIMAVPPPEVMYQPCADGVLWKEVPYWDILADPHNMIDKPDFVEAVMFGECKDDVTSFVRSTNLRGQSICCILSLMMILVQTSPSVPTGISPNMTPNVSYQPTLSHLRGKMPRQYGSCAATTHIICQWFVQEQHGHDQINVSSTISKGVTHSGTKTIRSMVKQHTC